VNRNKKAWNRMRARKRAAARQQESATKNKKDK